jgi:hypothetical protein
MNCCRSLKLRDRFRVLSYRTHPLNLLLEDPFQGLPLRPRLGYTTYFAQHPLDTLRRADSSSSASYKLGRGSFL